MFITKGSVSRDFIAQVVCIIQFQLQSQSKTTSDFPAFANTFGDLALSWTALSQTCPVLDSAELI